MKTLGEILTATPDRRIRGFEGQPSTFRELLALLDVVNPGVSKCDAVFMDNIDVQGHGMIYMLDNRYGSRAVCGVKPAQRYDRMGNPLTYEN
jgi:hypothetical protein